MDKLKRIELLLPADHPIWNYPKGLRRNKAVELLNTGLQIEDHLKRIEKKMENFLEKLSHRTPLEPLIPEEKDEPNTTNKVQVDIEGFGAL